MPRLSLTWKIFLTTAGIVSAVLGGTLFLTNRSAARAADAAVTRGLDATRSQVRSLLEGRERGLLNGAQVFVQNPGFVAAVSAKKREDVLDQSGEAVEQTGADWVQITDNAGVRLAKSDDPAAPSDTLAASALIGGALEGRDVTGVGLTGDSLIYQAVAAPIQTVGADGSTRSVHGVLMATKAIDTLLADSVKRSTDSEIVFYLLAADGTPRVVASTLPRDASLTALVQRFAIRDSSGGDAGPDAGAPPAPRAEMALGGTHYVGQGAPLRSAGGTPLGGFLALRSRDAELGAFNRLRRTILTAGALGLLLAFALSYLIALQITRPVTKLVAATRRAADGDYAGDIDVRSRDEIGALADAFRAMLADLREKQALVDLLSSPSGGRTVPLARASNTAQRAVASMVGIIEPGTTFGNRYEVKEVLGVGGMGVVYRAMDRELGEVIAVKTLKPELLTNDPTALERFKSEIRLARRISHRNVVRTHDIGDISGTYFITMEFVEGKSVKDLVRLRGRLPVPAVLTIAKQLCRALEVAHEQGVIHRDIKPQNMVVQPDGVLKVMDFGIARLATRVRGVTQAGMVIGTPEYMAPEQLLGDDVDHRVDIYAAGVVMYECLTGQLPFSAETPISLVAKLLETEAPTVRSVAPDIPEAISQLVARTMSRDRTARPATAEELYKAIVEVESRIARLPQMVTPVTSARGVTPDPRSGRAVH